MKSVFGKKFFGVAILIIGSLSAGAGLQSMQSSPTTTTKDCNCGCQDVENLISKEEVLSSVADDEITNVAALGNGCNNPKCKCRPWCRCKKNSSGGCACK